MKTTMDKLLDIFNECEDAKLKAFEDAVKVEDLTQWNRAADHLELAAYQKIKAILREVNLHGLPEVREQDICVGKPGVYRHSIPQAKVS